MGGRDHSCEGCGRGGFNDPDGRCECPPDALGAAAEAVWNSEFDKSPDEWRKASQAEGESPGWVDDQCESIAHFAQVAVAAYLDSLLGDIPEEAVGDARAALLIQSSLNLEHMARVAIAAGLRSLRSSLGDTDG